MLPPIGGFCVLALFSRTIGMLACAHAVFNFGSTKSEWSAHKEWRELFNDKRQLQNRQADVVELLGSLQCEWRRRLWTLADQKALKRTSHQYKHDQIISRNICNLLKSSATVSGFVFRHSITQRKYKPATLCIHNLFWWTWPWVD